MSTKKTFSVALRKFNREGVMNTVFGNGCVRRMAIGISLLALLVALLPARAFAQANEGAIGGNVLDPSGALVPGVAITAKHISTGATYDTVSSSAGAYRFPNLQPGVYEVTATKSGFKTAHLTGIVVQIATTAMLDIKLETGAIAETVVVEANAPKVESETAEMGTGLTDKQLHELPLPLGSAVQYMRSPEAFVFLAPGTVGPGSGSGSGGTFESKITGGQNYATEVLLDGASTFRSENGSSFDETAPSVDALGEFKVLTSTVPPEYDRTTGGIEVFSTKNGTNSYHGAAYDLFRNEDLDANSWANNYYGLPRANDKQNDYGGDLGGPVVLPHLYNGKDKTFFFFSWEQFRWNNGGTTVSTVPTAKERIGDFSEFLGAPITNGATPPVNLVNPCDGTNILVGEIFDPATTETVGGTQCRIAFMNEAGSTGNVIPTARLSTVGLNILSYYPKPQNSSLINNYAYAWSFPTLATTTTFRIDQNIGPKDKAYFTYSSRDNERISTTPEWATAGGDGRNQSFTTHFIRFGDDYMFTPALLNHINLGYNRTNSHNIGAGVRYGGGSDWATKLGISGVSGPMFPNINVPGVNGIGDNVDGDTIDNGFRFNDNISWIKGKHEMKFGFDWRYQQYNALNFQNTTGTYNFATAETAGTVGPTQDTRAQSGNALASLLLGQVDNANAAEYASQPRWLRSYYGVFFEDSFKITPTFTLMYGLRWSVDQPNKEAYGDTSNISLTTPNPGAGNLLGALVFAGKGAGRNGVTGERWANTYYKDFGPRLAFAWSPSKLGGQTVIRGGYGIIYAPILYADFGADNRVGFQASPSFSSVNGFSPAFTLNLGFPSFTPPPNLDPTQLNNTGPTYIDPSYGRVGMVQNWSLEIQRQLAADFILSVGYVGEHSTHLHSQFDAVNSLNPQYFSMGLALTDAINTTTVPLPYPTFPGIAPVARALTPYPQYLGFNTDCCLENLGQSTFDALEVQLQRRFRNGLNLMASYTWSKTLTDADSALPYFATLNQGGGALQSPFNKKNDKSISGQDLPQNFVVSYIYELPFGKGKKFLNGGGVVSKIVGGWSIGAIQRYESGQPIAFCCATGIPYYNGAIRFDQVAGQPIFSSQWLSGNFNPLTDRMFNYQAFYDPNYSGSDVTQYGYRLGTMARVMGNVRMKPFYSEDLDLMKRTQITESTNVLLKVEAFDLFNRHIWNRPGDLNANDYCILPNPPGPCRDPADSFGRLNIANTILGPRKVQLTLKLEF